MPALLLITIESLNLDDSVISLLYKVSTNVDGFMFLIAFAFDSVSKYRLNLRQVIFMGEGAGGSSAVLLLCSTSIRTSLCFVRYHFGGSEIRTWDSMLESMKTTSELSPLTS